MKIQSRYLTKSLFTLGCKCPTKLYYVNKIEYSNIRLEDPFLQGLAEGGVQITELAKLYYPEGKEITTLDPEKALAETNSYLEQENIVIFEAAIQHHNLFIRTDILVKQGNSVELIEVKAKSYDSKKPQPFFTKKGGIKADWQTYIQDIAFQTYVVEKAFPKITVIPYLLLADKHAINPIDKLNQKFLLRKGARKIAVKALLTEEERSQKILIQVPVNDAVQVIFNQKEKKFPQTFSEKIKQLATAYQNDQRIWSDLGAKCGQCEFKLTNTPEVADIKSGFQECWTHHLNWDQEDFAEPTILELWGYPPSKDKLIQQGIYKLADIPEDILKIKNDDQPGISRSQRQRLQIIKVKNNDSQPEIDLVGLEAEIAKLTFPLHFIDFETIQPAIPFHQGRKPYEAIAFQFSHHQIESDGTVHHRGDYLNTSSEFPNYEFVRQLKAHLTQDQGSIFRYSHHENTYLNYIYTQIEDETNPLDDALELQDFIKNISQSSSSRARKDSWSGDRNMIDLLEWVKRYYYDPRTKGSNSIKHILPAILNSSSYLQERYAQPNYGKNNEIKGSNFQDVCWVQWENDVVKDPYKVLAEISNQNTPNLSSENVINNGTAALTAYSKIQFTEMTQEEQAALKLGLLQYCELDTLAMVMIFEGWRNW